MQTPLPSYTGNRVTADTQRLYLHIAEQLASMIHESQILPGNRLPAERELAHKFDVSRQTVREALIALEVSGLVEIKPGSGVYVLKSDRLKHSLLDEDAPGPLEVMESRILIESEAAALAALRISNEELLKLKVYLTQMSTLVNENRIKEAEMFDRKFHLLIATATRNGAIFTMIEWLWMLREASEISRLFTEKVRNNGANPNIQAHEKIYTMLSRRDTDGSRKAMQEHLSQVSDTYALMLAG